MIANPMPDPLYMPIAPGTQMPDAWVRWLRDVDELRRRMLDGLTEFRADMVVDASGWSAGVGKRFIHPVDDNHARLAQLPANASVALPIGATVTWVNEINTLSIGIISDTLTLAGSSSTGTRTLAANGIASALKVAATRWIISGTGLT